LKRLKYVVNGIGFSSIESIKEHCRGIKQRATNGIKPDPEVYFILTGDDLAFCFDMVRQLADANLIIGDGLVSIKVGYVPPEVGKPHWGFYAIRTDGSESLFGFNKFGRSIDQLWTDRTTRAKRFAIAGQVIAYKEQYFDGRDSAVCEATGDVITRTSCHVDHADPWPFARIDTEFFAGKQIEVFDDGLNWMIKDHAICRAWQDFHRATAILRCVTSRFNLTRKAADL
jgi:hypothetical protein